MKNIKKIVLSIVKSALLVLVIGVVVFSAPILKGQEIVTTVDPYFWPMWPEPSSQISDLMVTEPATLLSIGRDVVAWPFFGPTTKYGNFLNLVGSDVFFTIKKEDGGFVTDNPITSSNNDFFVVLGNTTTKDPLFSNTSLYLREESILPLFQSEWLNGETPNEEFSETQFNNWKNFILSDLSTITSGGHFADSGHTPPQIVWPEDPWLIKYRVGNYTIPTKWKDRIVGIWSTNQGILQGFEVFPSGISPFVTRSWAVVPNPALRQSIYHSIWNQYRGSGFYRLTVLDGPITIRDVEINGQWRRIAVGTTGAGTNQIVKPQGAWTLLGQSAFNPSTSAPSVSNKGRLFGVYAFDLTNLETAASVDTLLSLWSVSNAYFVNSANAFDHLKVENEDGTAESAYSVYSTLKFAVSKPLIGYSKDAGGNRTWHLIIVGIEKGTNKYMWFDIKPENGSIRRSGYFRNLNTNLDEIAADIYDKKNDPPVYTAEQSELVFPSRILSAFPPPNDERGYNEPLLSDVYIYLSNGGIYRWDLNVQDSSPKWIVTLTNQNNQPTSPLTDFDISYVGGDSYLAANVVLTFQGGSDHETEGLIILNLTKLEAIPSKDRGIKVPPGQSGDIASSQNDYLLVMQLQLRSGAYSPEGKTVLASPVFILNRLYLAFYELTVQGKKTSEISRLYSFLFGSKMGAGNVINLVEGEDFRDLENVEASMMLVDSSGNLVLLDKEGNVLITLDTNLAFNPSQDDGATISNYETVYWKMVN